MATVRFTPEQIAAQKAKMEALETAIDEITTSGQSYSLQGSHSLTRANLADLQKQYAAAAKKYLLMLRGSLRSREMEVPRYV